MTSHFSFANQLLIGAGHYSHFFNLLSEYWGIAIRGELLMVDLKFEIMDYEVLILSRSGLQNQ